MHCTVAAARFKSSTRVLQIPLKKPKFRDHAKKPEEPNSVALLGLWRRIAAGARSPFKTPHQPIVMDSVYAETRGLTIGEHHLFSPRPALTYLHAASIRCIARRGSSNLGIEHSLEGPLLRKSFCRTRGDCHGRARPSRFDAFCT